MQTLGLRACLNRLRSLRPKYHAAAEVPIHRRHFSSLIKQQREEESNNVRVEVYWDYESCPIPSGVNASSVPKRITDALCSNGIKGRVRINAFGNVDVLSLATREDLFDEGVFLCHVPPSGKDSNFKYLVPFLISWVKHYPAPMYFFLISNNQDFTRTLNFLRMSQYKILIANSDCSSSEGLRSTATMFWSWGGLVKGEDVAVKGPWYGGLYKGVLDDSCLNMDQTVKDD